MSAPQKKGAKEALFLMYPIVTIFGRPIGTYALSSVAGILLAGWYACRAARRRGVDDNEIIVLLLVSAVGILLGSHVLYALTNLPALLRYLSESANLSLGDWFRGLLPYVGGAVFYGGLLGGLAAGALYLRIRRLPFAAYADIAAPAIPLFHAFGRIGCFLGGCCYGIPWEGGITYTRALSPEANGVARFPVQLLESALLFALFFLLAALFRRGALRGKLLALYLAVYAVLRFLLEFLRGDAIRGVYFGLSTSQWISLAILLALGVAALARACARRRARASA